MECTMMHQHGSMSMVDPLLLQPRSCHLSRITPSLEGALQAFSFEKKSIFGFPLHGFLPIIVCLLQTTSCLC